MKLLLVLGSYYPAQTGGADNAIYWLAKNLSKQNDSVAVATTDSGLEPNQVPFDKWIQTNEGQVFYARTRFHYLPLKMIWAALKKVVWADVVHVNSIFYPSSILVALYCYFKRKPIVWSVHGELSPTALSYSANLKKPTLWLINRIKHKVIFHCTGTQEQADTKKMLGSLQPTALIPLFAEIPNQLPHNPQELYLLFVGRLHSVKALDNLFHALAKCKSFTENNWQLKIAGKGHDDYENYLKQLSSELGLSGKIQFLGQVEGTEKDRLYAGAYCTLLPSHSENFSVIVVESLAQGTPVLASVHTPWQILQTYQAGWWCDNDPATLTTTLEAILNLPPSAYTAYRTNARRLAEKEYDISQNIHYWKDLYQSAIISNEKGK